MYKVFISDKPIILTDKEQNRPNSLVILYDSLSGIESMIRELESNDQLFSAVVLHGNVEQLWQDFCSLFTLIDAAGGLVQNKMDQLLFIFRRGKWDLPKGKLDDGETPQEAALREVEEECGLRSLQIAGEIGCTYHTYTLNEESILKTTYWYKMLASSSEELVPQGEEDITDIRWFDKDMLELPLGNTYAAIRELIQ